MVLENSFPLFIFLSVVPECTYHFNTNVPWNTEGKKLRHYYPTVPHVDFNYYYGLAYHNLNEKNTLYFVFKKTL